MKDNKANTNPLVYLMWIAIVGIIMMFAGLSSALIVKRSQANWLSYNIPLAFYYSTALILISSGAIYIAKRAFLERQRSKYTLWLAVTTILGLGFVALQYLGFVQLWDQGITLSRNVSFSFLYILVGLHAIHVLGGIIALIVLLIQSLSRTRRIYSPVSISLMSTYWHFVDILWLYLLVFLVLEA